MTVDKIDLKKQLKAFYQASDKQVRVVDVPPFNYLMIDGMGDPNTSTEFARAVETLYALSYTIKFHVKKTQEIDYTVMPLEGLWWADDMAVFATGDRAQWRWTLMIMQPDFVPPSAVEAAVAKVANDKAHLDVAKARFEQFAEGRSAQILHVGPFSAEGPTIERLHAFINERSRLRGRHHEIYLSDFRRTEPSRWRTIIRQPME